MSIASTKLAFFLFFLTVLVGRSQSISSIILDSATHKPVPYATIQLFNKGAITNEEGRFSLNFDRVVSETDSLKISSIGYNTIHRPLASFTEPIIYLAPKAIELNPVIVTNKNYTPEEIIALVKKNIEKNYNTSLTKRRLFLRETYRSSVTKSNYELIESTIEALNKNFLDSVVKAIPRNTVYYTESLGDLYGNEKSDDQKLDLIKASELYDKKEQIGIEEFEEKFNEIVKKNVKTDSYFKIKSGIFSFKVDGDELFDVEADSTDLAALNEQLEEKKENEQNRKNYFTKYKRQILGNLVENLPIYEDSEYNFLWKQRKYDFTLEEFTYIGDNAVYVIKAEPNGSADFRGKLFINADDFAIIRLDFENVKQLSKFSLMGISASEYLAKGSILFNKGENDKYSLSYYDVVKGNSMGVKRPLKIIEKNRIVKGRNRQNELHIKIDGAGRSVNRYEVVVFDELAINAPIYEAFKENNAVLPQYMPNYDPEFWKGYNIMEPNQAIKEFTSKVEISAN
ncbi:MAG: carboxypeptidase-like regulatory domain-containing protein [Flavobacteriaceae bacterium]